MRRTNNPKVDLDFEVTSVQTGQTIFADQKERFIRLDKGLKSREDVLDLYNFKNIRNNAEKPFLVQAVLNGAEQAGYNDGILFLNYE